jgi:hypothetical protein
MHLRKITAGVAMVGALGFTAVGLGAGIANAGPPAPAVAGLQQDHDPNWGGHGGRGDGRNGRGWDNNRGNWDNHANWGPGWGAPCVTGPLGFITFCP